MIQKKLDDEAQAKLKETSKSKKNLKPKKTKKPKKSKLKIEEIEIEPPKVDENTVVDVDDDYIKFEDEIHSNNKILVEPEKLNTKENEINLRNFQITGGIFEINCFEKPSQVKQMNLKMFLKTGNILNYQ